ncbi:MAG TPA: hypothetical protein VHG09_09735 [Longimicrobiales bacterium]|nr:hypothetical protein [Longimicrobiales bacterium]
MKHPGEEVASLSIHKAALRVQQAPPRRPEPDLPDARRNRSGSQGDGTRDDGTRGVSYAYA